ncbi:hypothetical protein CRE_23005 [Caenorhabditis remanei]|uniref:Protein kinase domain-containing protein n=1 Tax=Caenorhabditis remanei TaxID=31234 RepID=E3N4F5_CAERE|nr:hypothetical protein CRE_23005 [Caenorhabditis remanei]
MIQKNIDSFCTILQKLEERGNYSTLKGRKEQFSCYSIGENWILTGSIDKSVILQVTDDSHDDLYCRMRKWSRHFRYFRDVEEQTEEQKRIVCLEHRQENLTLSEQIGEGPFGAVFIGQTSANTTKVAVLNPRKEFQKYAQLMETRIHMLCNNKNFQTDQHFHIVMPFYVNGSLSTYTDKEDSIDRIECAKISYEILTALEYLHSKKVIHRDLKPKNILIGEGGEMRVSDFGLAEFQKRVKGKCGALNYMAPEELKSQQQNYQVDIWSFGCIVYELLSGK